MEWYGEGEQPRARWWVVAGGDAQAPNAAAQHTHLASLVGSLAGLFAASA
jgi:hypothetical protein